MFGFVRFKTPLIFHHWLMEKHAPTVLPSSSTFVSACHLFRPSTNVMLLPGYSAIGEEHALQSKTHLFILVSLCVSAKALDLMTMIREALS
jgi:hypothetical protein